MKHYHTPSHANFEGSVSRCRGGSSPIHGQCRPSRYTRFAGLLHTNDVCPNHKAQQGHRNLRQSDEDYTAGDAVPETSRNLRQSDEDDLAGDAVLEAVIPDLKKAISTTVVSNKCPIHVTGSSQMRIESCGSIHQIIRAPCNFGLCLL